MTDFDYENMQKKITARGAYHKKNGSKSKKCTMPSDYMTKAQREALNGPFTTIFLNQPMDWETFKGLSDTLKVKYIENLRSTYRANAAMLAQMFGVGDDTVARMLKKIGLKPGKRGGDGGSKLYKQKMAAWDAFCNGVVGGGDNVQPKEENPVEEQQPTCYDVDAEAFERAKATVDALCGAEEEKQEPTGFADAVKKHNEKPQWDLDSPDHVNAYRVEETEDEAVETADPVGELMKAFEESFEKGFDSEDKPAKDMTPAKLSKMQVNLFGYYESVSEQIDALLKAFGDQVRVRMEIVAE